MIPMKRCIRNHIGERPYICARWKENDCGGSLTVEHPFGRIIQEDWMWIFLCEKHHGLGAYWNKRFFNKELNRFFSYLIATDADFEKYTKQTAYWKQDKKYLTEKYASNSLHN